MQSHSDSAARTREVGEHEHHAIEHSDSSKQSASSGSHLVEQDSTTFEKDHVVVDGGPVLTESSKCWPHILNVASYGVQFILGLVALVLGATVGHAANIVLGLITALLVVVAVLDMKYYVFKKLKSQQKPWLTTFARILWTTVRIVFVLLSIVVIWVRSASSPDVTQFPSECETPRNCVRIAVEMPHRNEGLIPLEIATSRENVLNEFESVANSGSELVSLLDSGVSDGQDWEHYRFLTGFWGFADDTFLGVSCTTNGTALVELQSQSRLGDSDLGANFARLSRIHSDLQSTNFPVTEYS